MALLGSVAAFECPRVASTLWAHSTRVGCERFRGVAAAGRRVVAKALAARAGAKSGHRQHPWHQLRAVLALAASTENVSVPCPCSIFVSAQRTQAEVADCVPASGATPLRVML